MLAKIEVSNSSFKIVRDLTFSRGAVEDSPDVRKQGCFNILTKSFCFRCAFASIAEMLDSWSSRRIGQQSFE